jgi:hypothetical protein
MRWLSPVQSATRHVAQPFEWRGIEFAAHDTVNCMIGGANRDPSVEPSWFCQFFVSLDRYYIDRVPLQLARPGAQQYGLAVPGGSLDDRDAASSRSV